MQTLTQRYGAWALITGASSGIGAEYAQQLAAQGMNLALLARRTDRLEELGKKLSEQYGIQYRAIGADLNSDSFLPAVIEQTQDLEIGLLVNNAGFTNHGDFLDNDLAAEERLVNVNCRAATLLAHHFGRLMRDRKRGGIMFTASVVGFTSVPIWATYSGSKAYDLLLAESLNVELKPYGVDVMAVCPGSTRTEFLDYQGFWSKILVMEASDVVRGALKSIGKRPYYIAGWMNKLTIFSFRFIPRWLSARIFGFLLRDMGSH